MVTNGVDIAAYCTSVGDSPDAPNPTFAALEMFNRLGSVRLKTSLENRNSRIGALASAEESNISILVWDFAENAEEVDSSPKNVQLNLGNLPAGRYQQARYLGNDTRKETSLRIAESKLLHSDGRIQLEFELETNAVTLVELTPTAGPNL